MLMYFFSAVFFYAVSATASFASCLEIFDNNSSSFISVAANRGFTATFNDPVVNALSRVHFAKANDIYVAGSGKELQLFKNFGKQAHKLRYLSFNSPIVNVHVSPDYRHAARGLPLDYLIFVATTNEIEAWLYQSKPDSRAELIRVGREAFSSDQVTSMSIMVNQDEPIDRSEAMVIFVKVGQELFAFRWLVELQRVEIKEAQGLNLKDVKAIDSSGRRLFLISGNTAILTKVDLSETPHGPVLRVFPIGDFPVDPETKFAFIGDTKLLTATSRQASMHEQQNGNTLSKKIVELGTRLSKENIIAIGVDAFNSVIVATEAEEAGRLYYFHSGGTLMSALNSWLITSP